MIQEKGEKREERRQRREKREVTHPKREIQRRTDTSYTYGSRQEMIQQKGEKEETEDTEERREK